MSDEVDHESLLFDVLANPIRRKIIEEVAANEKLSYKELVRITQLKSGPLYHHLHKLENLLIQDDEKQYYLTKDGERAVKLLAISKSEEIEDSLEVEQEPTEPRILSFFGISLRPVVAFFAKHPYRTLAEFLILAIICGYLSYRDDILLIGNFTLSIETEIYFSYLSLILSWLFLGGCAELIARFVFKKKEGTAALISVTGIAFLPVFIFSIIIFIINLSVQVTLQLPLIPLLIIHGVFQIWTFIVLSTSLGVVKKLSLDKSIIISLILNYVQIMVVIFVLFR
ncbi:MAG: helix-turn-helix transcriptional regulator [Candidatus Heimdallarchaeota archaeon]|nr:helix-turn-helix transcriptional regulator [Candidatus Heimdallarchaeota archaeon]MCK4289422.1 helix-turn-helix transcriptional regulator [Candidatus Heimdallarchaeota archaeon]